MLMKDIIVSNNQYSWQGSLEVKLQEARAERVPHFRLFVLPAIQHLQHTIINNDFHSNYCVSIKYIPDLFIKERED